jgi:perosamine synthetase
VIAHQLPARSPIPAAALPPLALQTIAFGTDPRDQLRDLLTDRYDAQGCSFFGSGSQALQVAIETAIAIRDAPVLLPAYTCYEVASAAVGARARVALYDVDPNTLEPDWTSVRAAAVQGASAIVVAPLFGMPLDWENARQVADELDAFLIADSAQGHGSTWQGRPAGAAGDMTILSFGRGKGWTGAGGGALLWRGATRRKLDVGKDTNGIGFSTEVKSVARAASQWLLGRRALYALPASIPFLKLGETIYHAPTAPASMTRTSAALLLASDHAATHEVLRRRANARLYADALRHHKGILGAAFTDESGALRFPIRVKAGWEALKRSDAGRLGVAPGYPTSLRALPALEALVTNPQVSIGNAETLARELVTLPTHGQMKDDEMRRVIEIVARIA